MMDDKKEITIADLYPTLSPEEQAKAEYTLHRYLDVVRSIFDDLEKSGKLEDVLLEIRFRVNTF